MEKQAVVLTQCDLARDRGWAARLGASYDLTGKGRSLFRCANGVFYDRPFDNLWANVRLNGSAFETFDITADSTNFLAPALPQLAGFVLQPINTGLPDITWIDSNLRNAYVQSFFAGLSREVSSDGIAVRERSSWRPIPGATASITRVPRWPVTSLIWPSCD